MSRGEDAPGVAQLREEVASLRGDVDHIRSAMQDMHREVGSAVLLLSRFVGLEWDTGEAVRLAEKRSASASDAVDRLSNDVGTLEHRLAVAGEPKPENARGGGGGGGGSGSATSETVEDKISGATSETVEDKLGGASSETVEDKISVTTSETVDDKIGGATSETVKDRLGDAAPPTTGRRDSGGAAGGGGGEGQSLQSGRPRRSSDRDPPHPHSDIQGALPRHRNDGSKGGTLAPAIATATDDHVKGAAAAAAAAEGEDAGGHHLEDGSRCSGKQGLPSLSPDGEEGTLLSRRPSAGGTCGPTLPAVGRSQEGTTMAAVATVATAVAAAAAAVAVAVEPQRPDPLGDGALAPSSRALDQGESTRLRLPREVQLPVLSIADAEAGRPASVGQGAAGAKEHGREKDKCLEGEEEGEEEEDDQEENSDKEEEEEEEKDVKEEDEEEKDDEEVEGEREMEGVAHPTKSGNRKSGPTPLARTGGPFSGKHGDTQRAGAGQPLVANTSPGDSESDSSGSRRRGEDDASSEFEISVGGRENSGSRKMPQDERGAAADHTKHRASDEQRSTAGDSTATPPASPPASPPVISARSNSGGGGGGDGGGGGGGRNDDDSSQTSGSWTSRSSDSRSSEQSATSTPPSSRGRGGPDREVVERGGRQSRAAAAVAAAAAAAGAKAAVVESVPNKDIDVGVVESGEASIHAGGRGSQNRLASKIAVDGVPAAVGPVELQGGSRMPSSSGTKAAAPTPTPRKPAPLGTRRREKREEQEEESSGDEASHTSESRSRDHRAVIAAAAAGSTEIMEPRRTAAQGMEGTGSGRLRAAAVSRNASAQSGLAALGGGGSQSVQSLVSVATPPTLLRRRGGSGSFSDADNLGATGVVGEERER